MSVMIEARFAAEPSRFEQAARDNRDKLQAIVDRSKEQGCLHHRFYADNGSVVVVDEWENAEAFDKFFGSDPDIPAMMAAAGIEAPPEVRVLKPLDIDDNF